MAPHPTGYAVTAAALRRRILDGTYAPGAIMPTVRELGTRYNVGHSTAQRVLRQLEGEGLIAISARGAIVATHATVPAPADRLAHLADTGRILPPGGTSRFVRAGAITTGSPDGDRIARCLGLGPVDGIIDDAAVYRTRVTLDDTGQPIALSTSYRRAEWLGAMPGFLAPTPLHDGGLPALAEAFGEALAGGVDRYSARYPTPDESKILGVSPTAPLLFGQNWWRTESGNILEYGESLYAPGKSVEYPYEQNGTGS